MIYGVTGTQHGWTEAQRVQFTLMVAELDVTEWHHGDCIGVDDQASEVIRLRFGQDIIHAHPPDDDRKRAYVPSGPSHPLKPYLERNWDIAKAVETLFVIPKTRKKLVRSGTWHTYRAAKACKKRIIVIYADGSQE